MCVTQHPTGALDDHSPPAVLWKPRAASHR